jgi:hypothetical protein
MLEAPHAGQLEICYLNPDEMLVRVPFEIHRETSGSPHPALEQAEKGGVFDFHIE